MATITAKQDLSQKLTFDLTACGEALAGAYHKLGLASKHGGTATSTINEVFKGKPLTDTLSPFKQDGKTLDNDSKSTCAPEAWNALIGNYFKGLGKLALFETNPEWISYQVKHAKQGVKKAEDRAAIAASAVTTATKAKQKTALEALEKANSALATAREKLEKYQNMQKDRNTLRSAATSNLKDVRKSMLRYEFDEQVNYLLNDGKSKEESLAGAAKYCEVLKKQAGVNVKYGKEKYLTTEQENEDTVVYKKAIKALEALPQSKEVSAMLDYLTDKVAKH